LLDECDQADTEWLEAVREKIDAALSTSEPPVDEETFVSGILERFHQMQQAQQ